MQLSKIFIYLESLGLSKFASKAIPASLLFFLFIRYKISGPPLKVDRNIKGEVIIVTGSNTGIGYETAKHLAKKGATVIMACRDENRTKEAIKRIISETKNNSVLYLHLDLSCLASINAFVKEFTAKYDRLNILVNNAGMMGKSEREFTKDGFERTMGVNYFGTVHLTNLLLPLIEKTQHSRVVILSSRGHKIFSKLDIDDLNSDKKYFFLQTYGNTKQAINLYAKELQRHIDPNKTRVVCLNPGMIRTEIHRNQTNSSIIKKAIYHFFFPLFALLSKNQKQGAKTQLYCCLCDFEDLLPGGFYHDSAIKKPSALSEDRVIAKKLWDKTNAILKSKIN